MLCMSKVESQRRTQVIRDGCVYSLHCFRQMVSGQLDRKKEKRFNNNRTELNRNKATHQGMGCMGQGKKMNMKTMTAKCPLLGMPDIWKKTFASSVYLTNARLLHTDGDGRQTVWCNPSRIITTEWQGVKKAGKERWKAQSGVIY